MEDPHFENHAQDYNSLLFTESVVPWRNLLSMRLLLLQPSPCWPHHTVRDVTVYSEPPPITLRSAARRLFVSDCDMQEHNEAWKTVQLNTINSMTPSVYRPRTAPGSQVLPDYEIETL
ncbi:uncharacterized protein LOC126291860 [Schistocerca gregaria]|uniref:uncharacterized protein LOC126291860 n=1 Tax=Schistocerca gregaria TaxID=7010 RepID=UPI00211DF79F|nr:uncharacterized protein LOC126291860 [Schistocerca gregaria]